MKSMFFVLIVCIVVLGSCFKNTTTCGKITDVTIFKQAARKDTITLKFKVQFTPTDIRSFAEFKNEKKHTDGFWYDFIGHQYCIGDNLPD